MKMIMEFSFTAEVEATNCKNQAELKTKARELLIGKLPPNVRNRKVDINGEHDKITITVNRNNLLVRTLDVKEDKRHLKGKTK